MSDHKSEHIRPRLVPDEFDPSAVWHQDGWEVSMPGGFANGVARVIYGQEYESFWGDPPPQVQGKV